MPYSSATKVSSSKEKKPSKSGQGSRVNDWLNEKPRDSPWSSENTRASSSRKEHQSSSGGGSKK
ncbi:uncharacterized protein PG998_012694 [Apiospora kogelbergensis]|uniref:Uncharacterized protein n=1 Tax=Apiospora kogelbergensis TaxID=1337665 RepID=A0AAW0Q3Z3_9PEZI